MMADKKMFDAMNLDNQDEGNAATTPELQAEMDDISAAEGQENADVAEQLQLENAALKDQNLRLAADMENLRRRTQRDVADAKAYSVANFARDMLSVLDNLARALEAIAPDVRAHDNHLNALAEGVEMTSRAMITALERHGVKKIEAEGAKFDPNFHQAMFEIPDQDKPAGTIATVVQEGYMIGERVLRPVMVGITAGGVKEADCEVAAENL